MLVCFCLSSCCFYDCLNYVCCFVDCICAFVFELPRLMQQPLGGGLLLLGCAMVNPVHQVHGAVAAAHPCGGS